MKKYYVDYVIQGRLTIEANSEQEAREKAYIYDECDKLILADETAGIENIECSEVFDINDVIEVER